jgi:hypothetical protein
MVISGTSGENALPLVPWRPPWLLLCAASECAAPSSLRSVALGSCGCARSVNGV